MAREQEGHMQGNQGAVFMASGKRLADHLGLDFTTPIWWHLSDQGVLDESRIRERVVAGEGLSPSPGRMGEELTTIGEHEARIAWLARSDHGAWAPILLSAGQGEGAGKVVLMVHDGHHRLLSCLIKDARVVVSLVSGQREAALACVEEIDGYIII